MARTPLRWMLRGAGCGLGIFVVSFFLPLGGPPLSGGARRRPALSQLAYVVADAPAHRRSWWRRPSAGSLLRRGTSQRRLLWTHRVDRRVARALGRGAPWPPPDDEHG